MTKRFSMNNKKEFWELPATFKCGVITGKSLFSLLENAKVNRYAIPGVNIVGSNSINACMEAAMQYGGPIIITISKGGGEFFAGKAISNENFTASITGCIAAAKHVRQVAKFCNVPIILHTDHCTKASLPWIDGLLEVNRDYFEKNGEPLFSSHMIDLSEEPLEENISICRKYLEKFAKINVLLEFELGVTGGEEDGVDNSNIEYSRLYTQPKDVWYAYEQLSKVPNAMFTCAASFGNVHGVYSPGNVRLQPTILHKSQSYVQKKLRTKDKKPMFFVFHGGSGSSIENIKRAIDAGVIKMNIDTDTQWAFWNGIREYEIKNHYYLQNQIGNPNGLNIPNKKIYDPRMYLRCGEKNMIARLLRAAEDLNCVNVLN